jgi:hypothetical protein
VFVLFVVKKFNCHEDEWTSLEKRFLISDLEGQFLIEAAGHRSLKSLPHILAAVHSFYPTTRHSNVNLLESSQAVLLRVRESLIISSACRIERTTSFQSRRPW